MIRIFPFRSPRWGSASRTARLIRWAPWLPPKISSPNRLAGLSVAPMRPGDGCPDGVSRHADPVGPEPARRLGEAHEDPVRKSPEDLVRLARDGVLLGNGRRHAHEAGCKHGRSRRVAAHPDHNIRTEAPDDPAGLDEARRDLRKRRHRPCDAPPLDPFDLEGLQVKAELRQHPRLEPPLRPDEKNVVRLVAPAEFLRDGHSREEMTARSSSRDQNLHTPAPLRLDFWYVDRLSRIPTAMQLTISAVPP